MLCGRPSSVRCKSLNSQVIEVSGGRVDGVCDNLSPTARKSLILNGEMSEWLKEHAWKLIPLARADAHRHASTHSPSTPSRNDDVLRRIPVDHSV